MATLSHLTVIAALATCMVPAQPVRAQIVYQSTTGEVNDVDCRGLKLVAASGVPTGLIREYKFHGICKILRVFPTTGSWAGYEWSEGEEVTQLGSVWADLAASWNSSTGEFREDAKTQSPYAGRISMVLRCAGDPVLTSVPCKPVTYSNTTGWDGFDWAYQVPRPVSRGKTTLQESTAISQQAASTSSNPPPPPPAPSSPTVLRAPVPTGTEPVAAVSPQLVVQPTRATASPTPTPPPPPQSSGGIALEPALRVELEDGRAIVADQAEGSLRWAIVGPKGEMLRRFPPEAKLTEKKHNLTIQWPGGSYHAGKRADKAKGK